MRSSSWEGFSSGTDKDERKDGTRCAADEKQTWEEGMGVKNAEEGGGKGKILLSTHSGDEQSTACQDKEQQLIQEVPLREREEEEIVALSSYLACAGRGWPWAGKDVLWAEYVSLNGHHRCVP